MTDQIFIHLKFLENQIFIDNSTKYRGKSIKDSLNLVWFYNNHLVTFL